MPAGDPRTRGLVLGGVVLSVLAVWAAWPHEKAGETVGSPGARSVGGGAVPRRADHALAASVPIAHAPAGPQTAEAPAAQSVELLDAGSEPRLRFVATPGSQSEQRYRARLSSEVRGAPAPPTATPVMEFVLVATLATGADGRFVRTVRAERTVPTSPVGANDPLAGALEPLLGRRVEDHLDGGGVLLARTIVLFEAGAAPDGSAFAAEPIAAANAAPASGAPGTRGETTDALARLVDQLAVPTPDAAVGVGACWSASVPSRSMPAPAVWRAESVGASAWSVSVTYEEQHASPPARDARPGAPSAVRATTTGNLRVEPGAALGTGSVQTTLHLDATGVLTAVATLRSARADAPSR